MQPPGLARRLEAARRALDAAKTADAISYSGCMARIDRSVPPGQCANIQAALRRRTTTTVSAGQPRFAVALCDYLLYWCQAQALDMLKHMVDPRRHDPARICADVDARGPIERYAKLVFDRFIRPAIAIAEEARTATSDDTGAPAAWTHTLLHGPGSLQQKQQSFVNKVCLPFAAVIGVPPGVFVTSSALAARA